MGRRVKADAVMRAGNIIVDRRGQADHGNAVFGERQRAAERSVAADSDYTVDMILFADGNSLCHAFFRFEFKATVGIKDGTAARDDVRYVGGGLDEHHIVVYKPLIALINTVNLNASCKSRSCRRSVCGVHAGSVAARRKYAYSSELFHCFCLPLFCEYFY